MSRPWAYDNMSGYGGSQRDRATWRARLYDRFKHFRSGTWPYDEEARRQANYGNPVLPRKGKAKLDFSKRSQVRRQYRLPPKPTPESLSSAPEPGSNLAQAYEVYQLIKNGFGRDRLFEFTKTLGYGGNGLAALFHERDQDGRMIRRLVAKVPLRFRAADARRSLAREKRMMRVCISISTPTEGELELNPN